MKGVKVGIIAGSGFARSQEIEEVDQLRIHTPFGNPSSDIDIISITGYKAALLRRHGQPPSIPPHEVNSRANIYALKSLGVERVISLATVGSLTEGIKPLDIVIPDQGVDRTWGRNSTFFGSGLIVHIGLADPFCKDMRRTLREAANAIRIQIHDRGTYVCIQGPSFSTRAESEMHRILGFDIIGMTLFPEAKLAREAEMCYATIALVTDYDVWHEHEEDVSEELLLENSRKLQAQAQKIVRKAVPRLARRRRTCDCASALANAFGGDVSLLPGQLREQLRIIVAKYDKS